MAENLRKLSRHQDKEVKAEPPLKGFSAAGFDQRASGGR